MGDFEEEDGEEEEEEEGVLFQYSEQDEESRFEYKFNIICRGLGDPQSSATPLVHVGWNKVGGLRASVNTDRGL